MSDDYSIPRPSKIKLKETRPEIAHRLYRKEQRRAQREARRISRANGGLAVTPPRETETETISPPRNPIVIDDDNDDEDLEYGAASGSRCGAGRPGGVGRTAEEFADRMAWLEAEELGRFDHPLADFDVHVPLRYRQTPNSGFVFSSHFHSHAHAHAAHFHSHASQLHAHLAAHTSAHFHALHSHARDAASEVRFSGGPIPSLGTMDEATYSAWVRDGMARLRQRSEAEASDMRRRMRVEADRAQWAEREARDREREAERARRAKVAAREKKRKEEKEREEEDGKRKVVRARWRARCAALADAEVVDIEMGWEDVPWPMYAIPRVDQGAESITPSMVADFLNAVARDDAGNGGDLAIATKRVMRESIKVFHPDRFFSRVLPRVKEDAREAVKQGVERTSRIINELAAR